MEITTLNPILYLFVAMNKINSSVCACVFGRKSKTWIPRVCAYACLFFFFIFLQLAQIAQYVFLLFCYSPCFYIPKRSFSSLALFDSSFSRSFFLNQCPFYSYCGVCVCVLWSISPFVYLDLYTLHMQCINVLNKWIFKL